MRTLIVEEDLNGQKQLEKFFQPLGTVSLAAQGAEALEKFASALGRKSPYDLVCLGPRLADLEGKEVLGKIRALEELVGIGGLQGVKVIMKTVPMEPQDLLGELVNLGLLPPGTPLSVFLS